MSTVVQTDSEHRGKRGKMIQARTPGGGLFSLEGAGQTHYVGWIQLACLQAGIGQLPGATLGSRNCHGPPITAVAGTRESKSYGWVNHEGNDAARV